MKTLSTEDVWRELSKASFAIVSYVTPGGEPRSSGVVYEMVVGRLYIAVARTAGRRGTSQRVDGSR